MKATSKFSMDRNQDDIYIYIYHHIYHIYLWPTLFYMYAFVCIYIINMYVYTCIYIHAYRIK